MFLLVIFSRFSMLLSGVTDLLHVSLLFGLNE
jgi:hypothetical protein